MAEQTRQRTAGGVVYTLIRRKVKNINLRVRADGSVVASAAPQVPAAQVDAFVASRAAWVQAAQAKARARAEAAAAQPLPDPDTALAAFTALSDAVYPAFAGVLGGQKPTIRVRAMKSRWGVCHPGKLQITLALQLYHQPPAAQIYVVVHEYCHFLVPNHSPAFWAQVEQLLPDWKARRRLLREAAEKLPQKK